MNPNQAKMYILIFHWEKKKGKQTKRKKKNVLKIFVKLRRVDCYKWRYADWIIDLAKSEMKSIFSDNERTNWWTNANKFIRKMS